MELEGKVWKDGKFWLVEVPSLNVMTQGKTRKEALFMIEDAITGLINCYFKEEAREMLEIHINDYKDVIGLTSTNTRFLMAFSLKRQREISGSTIQEVAERLGSKSPNSYAQYEKGKIRISLDKYEQLLEAVNPIHHPMLRIV
ncbi:MAG TPA: type II toxin-antitoxin system HicB family antitoxin [Waddliaceae bacterium]